MNKTQKGFSLIELCFAIAGLTLVIGIIYFYYGKLQNYDAVQSESLEFADHYRVADTALRDSFRTAGFNFTLPGDHVFSGEYPLFFQPNSGWLLTDELRTDGTSYRQTGFSGVALKSNLIFRKGSGSVSFQFQNGNYQVGLQNVADNSEQRLVMIAGNRLIIRENGENVFAYTVDISGATRQYISIALGFLQGRATCVTDYYLVENEIKTLIFRSPNSCPTYPLEVAADSTENRGNRARILNLKVAGTDMISREPISEQSFVYPSYHGQDIYSPIIQVADESGGVPENDFGSVIFLGGSIDTDVYYTNDSAVIKEGITTTINISKPSASVMASPIAENDVVNLIDYGGRQSVLGIVTAVSSGSLNFTPLSEDSSYGGFYTLPIKYSEHLFSTGASVVKVAAPVEWRCTGNQLLRREAGTSWQTVILGVSKAQITQSSINQDYSDNRGSSVIRSYSVSLLIKQDGTDTAIDGIAPEQPFHATYTPLALNLGFQ